MAAASTPQTTQGAATSAGLNDSCRLVIGTPKLNGVEAAHGSAGIPVTGPARLVRAPGSASSASAPSDAAPAAAAAGFFNGLAVLANAITHRFQAVQISGSSARHTVDLPRDGEETGLPAAARPLSRRPTGSRRPRTSDAVPAG
ncbi:hypothetical protein [Streptomyces milbemycinicus]|uniref:hypothetical protein n=1 Tax=Streptomyces milbemycinicus TaxID=476552 RepID=UPI0021F88B13|nr:hypothetical protein [Streptomyces milbemycinicus]